MNELSQQQDLVTRAKLGSELVNVILFINKNNKLSSWLWRKYNWIKEKGFDWTSETAKGAAENGQLETLKYLVDNGCKWDSSLCGSCCGRTLGNT